MNYQVFAALYDQLMADAPYDEWLSFTKKTLGVDYLEGIQILDVGCGTGELLLSMLDEGADVTGVDLSSEMLVVARDKCMKKGVSPLLIHQDMRKLGDLGQYDVATIFCDSLNYLETPDDVKAALHSVSQNVVDNGWLLFDVHSISKIEDEFVGQTFADSEEEISYIWHSFPGEHQNSVEHELTFFVKQENGLYERYEELHKQRTYSVEEYTTWLLEAGFEVEAVTADFSSEIPSEESMRIFFAARKKKRG
ncbi:class I SAM-dependent methyltransferase [Alkalihalophilus marmarensis]|jgi:ubiquinone/menaquinone biosynthesis C-methylase UbiE|uniref:Methyltransferase n=1 Tax=Alkalihalophilus marmarensis DSM 21297 TaxID=1188261 RepID=U6SVI0_9BACI|nr:class I SAM-dependent methyltransferase [Alkalihalophilus marmarensis]ERN54686.1 methyltransferase [Alkalihalophilus marmarensis DSM 21297]MCM3488693.1 class I SAM-dependent methyltransferase [Alkalihalophilus marmarensis]